MENHRMQQDRVYQREQRKALLASILLILAYFLVPVEPWASGVRLVVRSIATALVVIVIAWLVTRQVGREIAGRTASYALLQLGVLLIAGVLAFALGDYVLAVTYPEQFVNLRTKIDALYFSLATLTTIGYGDVHPAGQLARASVCLQMLFSIGVLATGASLLFKRLTTKRSAE